MEPIVKILTNDAGLRDLLTKHFEQTSIRLEPHTLDQLEDVGFEECDFALLDSPDTETAGRWVTRIKSANRSCQVLLLTPRETPPHPEALEQWGVRTWLGRPVETGKLLEAVTVGVQTTAARARQRLAGSRHFDAIIGEDPAFRAMLERARKASQSPDTTVLLLGQTGTGKQLLARAIHDASRRAGSLFLDLNCAALPPHLVETELFGHERGAFTGAVKSKQGLLEVADGGTVFLDEIGELNLGLQVKLLKFLDQKSFRRVQGLKVTQVDVRLIAATNRELDREVERGQFREDLFHRLNVLNIRIPPLRERGNDVVLLARAFLARHAPKCGSRLRDFSREALELLREYSWPGNVRELSHVMERCALMLPEREVLEADDLRPMIPRAAAAPGIRDVFTASMGGAPRGETGGPHEIRIELPSYPVGWDSIERAILQATLQKSGGNVSEAARWLGLGRGQLRYRMKRLGVESLGPQRYRPQRRMKRRRAQNRAA